MIPGVTPFAQRPQKDPEIGAFRCKSCGMTIFREELLCDECQAAAGKRHRAVLRVCLALVAMGILVAAVVIALDK